MNSPELDTKGIADLVKWFPELVFFHPYELLSKGVQRKTLFQPTTTAFCGLSSS
jgi:hypothetical protein